MTTATTTLDPRLAALEAESIDIIRQTAGQFDRPALLFSGGKDSVLVLELAKRAFAPAPVPLELLHVDTGHNFPEVIAFRDKIAAQPGITLRVAHVQDWIDRGELTERADGTRNPLQTVPLVETIADAGYDAVMGGARRDEEKARAKERVFSVRDSFGEAGPRRQRPELWGLYNGRHAAGERRVFPISNWTEADVWATSAPAASSCRRSTSPPARCSTGRHVARAGRVGQPARRRESRVRTVRYRTVGDMSCTGAVESTASTIDEVIAEIAQSTLTERGATRADDKLSESSMEDRKKEGYF